MHLEFSWKKEEREPEKDVAIADCAISAREASESLVQAAAERCSVGVRPLKSVDSESKGRGRAESSQFSAPAPIRKERTCCAIFPQNWEQVILNSCSVKHKCIEPPFISQSVTVPMIHSMCYISSPQL